MRSIDAWVREETAQTRKIAQLRKSMVSSWTVAETNLSTALGAKS